MRLASVSIMVLAGFALSACTGEMGDTTCNTIDIPTSGPCVATSVATGQTPVATVIPVVPLPTNVPPSTNVGNSVTLATGDTTIALEFANIISPKPGSLSKLTEISGATNTAKLEIDTKAATNNTWPVAKTMDEFAFGTNSTFGAGLGANYKEYAFIDLGAGVDEELQVWNWTNSHATQYRDVSGAGEARKQAWSFGGNATPVANMPPIGTGGSATYIGKYGATSKTWNWVDPNNPARTLSANGSWQVVGNSLLTADFGTAKFVGTLTPIQWTGWQTLNGGVGRLTVNSTATGNPNFSGFMNDDVIITGTITGNTIANGKAKLDPAKGWLNGNNPAYAGFFGNPTAGPSEVTGVYNFVAVAKDPIGGEPPINDDRRAYVQQSGVFHGCNNPGIGTCPP